MTTRLLFKVLNEDGSAYHGGRGRWPLPTTKGAGKALSVTGELLPCANGLHLCEARDLIYWLGPAIYTVQVPEGVEEMRAEDKLVVRTARLERRLTTWTERTARLFACDCAERVLDLTNDPRSAEAIAIARRYADGQANPQELGFPEPAGITTWAAGPALWAACGPWGPEPILWAAWAASAARAARAARAGAGEPECQWQTQRLMQYLKGEVG